MDLVKNILTNSIKIFDINEKNNPETIFGDKTFYICGDSVTTEPKDSYMRYYEFEHPDIDGMIIKYENNIYCIKAGVNYINTKGKRWAFAKVRIDNFNGIINIRGRRNGSWEDNDLEDEDYSKNPDYELSFVLYAMNKALENMYIDIKENNVYGKEKYISNFQKKLLKYNIKQ